MLTMYLRVISETDLSHDNVIKRNENATFIDPLENLYALNKNHGP